MGSLEAVSGQAEPVGRAVDEEGVAGRAAQGQAGISGTKEPQLLLPEHFHLEKCFTWE